MQQDEARAFLRIAGDHQFLRWLADKEAALQKNLMMQADPVQIYRTQGELRFIETLRKGAETARLTHQA